ncbi:ABC transporter permease [Macrococcus capreoli]|uniref:ABC transporter permease n=1 Tax=Macrococcus capreoli TaxID=2982690 RepID=UPI0021D5A798|nr:ABC transporter permease [Macrococcus sp. TMW 2.2395]MCU7556936.1 ABC transporter permease [Macrococcus sp. TMW 2.2395]
MKRQLFSIYHSFLLKKWYLLVYILLLFISVIGVLLFLTHMHDNKQDKFSIGLVDLDQSKETQLILKAIGDGQSMGKDIELKHYDENTARQKLKQHQLDGYFVFDKGMTQVFYQQGNLPISVYTYDQQSLESIIIYQLTDSVYSRLMLSMGGAKAYKTLYPETTKDEMLTMMTDMLFTGLDRKGAFDEHTVKLYDSYQYYTLSAYFISLYLFFLALFSILKMNQEQALKERLAMFHYSYEKLTLVRGVISLCYTCIIAGLGLWALNHWMAVDFESYNTVPLIFNIGYYLLLIFICLLICEFMPKVMNILLNMILTLLIIVFSGATIPSVYFKDAWGGLLYHQPFNHIFNHLVELLLNNYLIKTEMPFYITVASLTMLLIITLIWRYRR